MYRRLPRIRSAQPLCATAWQSLMGQNSEADIQSETLIPNYTFFFLILPGCISVGTSLCLEDLAGTGIGKLLYVCAPKRLLQTESAPLPLSRACAPALDHCGGLNFFTHRMHCWLKCVFLLSKIPNPFLQNFFPPSCSQPVLTLADEYRWRSQNCLGWKRPLKDFKGLLVCPPCQEQRYSTRPDCSEFCPIWSWIFPGMGHLPILWETWASASPPPL